MYSVVSFLEDLIKVNSNSFLKELLLEGEMSGVREVLTNMFNEWVRFFHHPSSTELGQIAYANQVFFLLLFF
jgi:hypothetical protein